MKAMMRALRLPRVARFILAVVVAMLTQGLLSVAPAYAASDYTYQSQLVNGDFEYPGGDFLGTADEVTSEEWNSGITPNWVHINPLSNNMGLGKDGIYGLKGISGFNQLDFQWRSTQSANSVGQRTWGNRTVELFRDIISGNYYAEATPTVGGTVTYQSINIGAGGAVMRYRFKHAARADGSKVIDRMQVFAGREGYEQPRALKRIASNGESFDGATGQHNDDDTNQVGYVSMYATTPKDGTNRHRNDNEGAWDEYEGWWAMGSTENIFTLSFQSYYHGTAQYSAEGNYIDDVQLDKCYPLAFDANGGGGTVPTAGKNPVFGYDYYYAVGDVAGLPQAGTESVFAGATDSSGRTYSFIGWTATKQPWAKSESEVANLGVSDTYTMESASGERVFAAYARNPHIVFKDERTGEVIAEVTVPYGSTIDEVDELLRDGYAVRAASDADIDLTDDGDVAVRYVSTVLRLKVPVALDLVSDAQGNLSFAGAASIENETESPLWVSGLSIEAAQGVTVVSVDEADEPDCFGLRLKPGDGEAVELSDYVGTDPRAPSNEDAWRVEPGGKLSLSGSMGRIGGFNVLDPAQSSSLGVIHWSFSTSSGNTG